MPKVSHLTPTRRGRSVCLTLEHEAVEILRTLCQSGRSHGHLVSALLRQEEQRRLDARTQRGQQWAAPSPLPEEVVAELTRAGL